MGRRTIVPFGPQHPALPEPVHLDLEVEDETVVRAVPSIGYVHRGLEKLVERRDYHQMTYVMERVCGICSFGHSWGYCGAVEGLMGVPVPERAEALRRAFHELSRVHSHLLWLGLLADGMGFDSLFMQCWRIREKVLDIFESVTGGRVIISYCRIGGVVRDVPPDEAQRIVGRIGEIRAEVERTAPVFVGDSSVRNRLHGVGVVSKEDMVDLCGVGPTARGSGVNNDMRASDPRYRELGFAPVLREEGDCLARCLVRVDEALQSLDMAERCLRDLPEGEWRFPVKGNPPAGEYVYRLEQPRGEAFYYVRGNGTKNLVRARVRTPTNINIPVMVRALQGSGLQDVSMEVLSIDPCISCTERRSLGGDEDGREVAEEPFQQAGYREVPRGAAGVPREKQGAPGVRSRELHPLQHLRQELSDRGDKCGQGEEGPGDRQDVLRPVRLLRGQVPEEVPGHGSRVHRAEPREEGRLLHRAGGGGCSGGEGGARMVSRAGCADGPFSGTSASTPEVVCPRPADPDAAGAGHSVFLPGRGCSSHHSLPRFAKYATARMMTTPTMTGKSTYSQLLQPAYTQVRAVAPPGGCVTPVMTIATTASVTPTATARNS